MVHLSAEDLSALADGELEAAAERTAREHLSGCATCAGDLLLFQGVERELRLAPTLSCREAHPLVSAQLDGEADQPEAAAAARHLGACASCRAYAAQARSFAAAVRALGPSVPSARVDAAVRRLAARPARRRLVPGLAVRGVLAGTAVVALLLAGLSRAAPVASLPPDQILVASLQQVVLDPRTNTMYVLDSARAAVVARDAATNATKATISVGGRPTALALNTSTNRLLVLDSSAKRVTEIDATSNSVVSAASVPVSGTPTSINVDPDNGKIVVTSAATTAASGSGSVTVLDGATKTVDRVRDVSVAAQTVAFDPGTGRAALVSAKETALVDQSYTVLATLPGGVGAAFAQHDDRIAILSPSAGGSRVFFAGRAAPAALLLPGSPRAITSLPDGGFLVLAGIGSRSRVSYVAPDGREAGSVELDVSGEAVVFDPATRRFTVAGGASAVSGEIPSTLSAATSPAPTPPSAPSAPSAVPASASPTPAPSASPSPLPGTAAVPSPTPNALAKAPGAVSGFVRLALPDGRQPVLASQSGQRLWVLDDRNQVDTVDMTTGETFTITSLPRGAQIGFFAAGRGYAYALDARSGQLHVVNAVTELVRSYTMNFLRPVSSIAVGPDDRLWIGLSGAPYLFGFDPRTERMASYDLGAARVSVLTTDATGRILYADDSRGTVGALNPATGRLVELAVARSGVTTALAVDGSSTLWLGTSSGDVYAIRGGGARLVRGLGRPVSAIALDQRGVAWYLAPLPAGTTGFGFGALDGTQVGSVIRSAVSALALDSTGKLWLADPQGGFFVSREALR